jgi:hypothetical protein
VGGTTGHQEARGDSALILPHGFCDAVELGGGGIAVAVGRGSEDDDGVKGLARGVGEWGKVTSESCPSEDGASESEAGQEDAPAYVRGAVPRLAGSENRFRHFRLPLLRLYRAMQGWRNNESGTKVEGHVERGECDCLEGLSGALGDFSLVELFVGEDGGLCLVAERDDGPEGDIFWK